MGGLGNQLFALTAGEYVAHKLQVNLRAYLRKPGPSETRHPSSVRSLVSDRKAIVSLSKQEQLWLAFRFAIRNFATKLGMPASNLNRITKLHVSPVVGFDKTLEAARPGDYIVGYFQTHIYLDELRLVDRMPKLALTEKSTWFRDHLQEIAETNPTVIHVRRGDYLLDKNDYIGVLSVEYFLNSLRLLESGLDHQTGDKPIWIFSDQPSVVKKEFSGIPEFDSAKFIDTPPGSDPAETLILMSSASSIVISNSTFSWWSAALSKGAKVVAPSKWFKRSEDPRDLIPANWLRAESSWLEKRPSE
jgi:hypothetical protein